MFKRSLIIVGCLILIVLNINCSQNVHGLGAGNSLAFDEISSNPNGGFGGSGIVGGPENSSGNGTPYGGKLRPGVYVRELSERVCGPQIKNLGEITVTDSYATGKLVDAATCTVSQVNLNLNDVEHADYKQGRLGYVEGIYSLAKVDEVSGFDEVWCRREGSSTALGFDVVIKADYKKRTFISIAASAAADAQGKIQSTSYQPLPVSRNLEQDEKVRYRADGFELEIRKRSFNSVTGMMQGDLNYKLNGIFTAMKINCRLGGELDILLPVK